MTLPLPPSPRALRFGPFHLVPSRRTLLEGERPVALGSRAFDLLVALTERPGQLLPASALMARVWHDTVVDAGSLRVHMTALRKALGEGRGGRRYIVNVPAQGYSFVAPVEHADAAAPCPPPVEPVQRPRTLPAVTPLLGRDAAIDEIVGRLGRHRCISIVGPGGMGKTALAAATAERAHAAHADGAVWLDLAPLTGGGQVATALASALGLIADPAAPLAVLGTFLRDKHLLLVLDNCEHLVDHVAELAEQLLRVAARLHLLATSREALRIEGEWVHRLAPLGLPAADTGLTAAQALAWPAVQLFVERTSAGHDGFVFDDAAAAAAGEICRRLDGIPLAIELAAASVESLGVQGLAAHLGDRLALLTHGRRTALPRHQTLRATLDWSYALLAPPEQQLLRQLAVFRGAFPLDAALAVGAVPGGAGAPALAEALYNLVAKSMLSVDTTSEPVHYRLLESTRAYALEALAARGETAVAAQRHARYLESLFAAASARPLPPVQWLELHGRRIDDLRAALQWAFAPGGERLVGIALAATTAPLWFSLSLMAEYRQIAEQALAGLAAEPASDQALEMRLREAYGHALWHTRGGGPAMTEAFSRALALAESQGAAAYQLRAVWGLWLICNTSGDYAGSERLARHFGAIAGPTPTPDLAVTHDRMMALGLHFHGDQAGALVHARRVLEHPGTVNHTSLNSGFQFDQRVSALTVLARILWVLGRPHEALAHATQSVDEALAIDHTLSLCYAIANGAAPVAFWAGEWDTAQRWTELLLQRAGERSLPFWLAFGRAYRLLLALDGAPVRPDAAEVAEALHGPAVGNLLRETLCTVDPSLAEPALLARAEEDGASWCAPELLRVRAAQLRERGDGAAADALLQRALRLARDQQALAWELRCGIDLARSRAVHDPLAARATLGDVLARFEPGAGSADLSAARALLASWA